MDNDETAQVVRAAGLDLPDHTIALIQRRTEGWALAINLAMTSIREKDDPIDAVSAFGGDDRLISEYVWDEMLRNLPKRHFRFMTRTAILHGLTPSLCDAVVGSKGSAALLAELERSNSLVMPLSGAAGEFRYHQLLRDVLLAELHRVEPDLVPELNRRAASWSEANDLAEDAIAYAQAASDVHRAARLVCSLTRRYMSLGRVPTLERWLSWFDENDLITYPPLAIATAWCHAFIGDEDPVRWLRIAEDNSFEGRMPDGSSSYEAAVAMLRAALCLDGPHEMDADVARSAEMGRASNEWRVFHHLLAGEAALLLGEPERARALFHEAAEVASPAQAGGHAMALSELAAMSADAGEWDEADRWIPPSTGGRDRLRAGRHPAPAAHVRRLGARPHAAEPARSRPQGPRRSAEAASELVFRHPVGEHPSKEHDGARLPRPVRRRGRAHDPGRGERLPGAAAGYRHSRR